MEEVKLTYDELIDGEIYHAILGNAPSKRSFLFIKKERIDRNITYIWLLHREFKNNVPGSLDTRDNASFSHYIKASNREAKWLRQCIKENRYIDFKQIKEDEIINNYELY